MEKLLHPICLLLEKWKKQQHQRVLKAEGKSETADVRVSHEQCKKAKKSTLCWHISKFYFDFFHRAKPATEVHCRIAGHKGRLTIKLARRSVVSASSAL